MITSAEIEQWAQRFGVAANQVKRDHLISHILNSLGISFPEVRFFGGTALCRTYLPGSRLSEDIDLLAGHPRLLLASITETLPRSLRREFPDAQWQGGLVEGDGVIDFLEAPGYAPIKVYVGHDGPNTRAWAFEPTEVLLRYSDLPATRTFQCPTLPTFCAMKLAAWFDRHAPRDLYDLAGLADLGALSHPRVEELLREKTRVGIIEREFDRVPRATSVAWDTELAAQVGRVPTSGECLERVRHAIR